MGAVPKQVLNKKKHRDWVTLVLKLLVFGKLWQVWNLGKWQVTILLHGFGLSISSLRPRHYACMDLWNAVHGDGCIKLPAAQRLVWHAMASTLPFTRRTSCRRAGGLVFPRADRQAVPLHRKQRPPFLPLCKSLPGLESCTLPSWSFKKKKT